MGYENTSYLRIRLDTITSKEVKWMSLFFIGSLSLAFIIGATGPPVFIKHERDSRAIMVKAQEGDDKLLPPDIQRLVNHGEDSQLEVSSTKIMIDYMTKKNQFLFVEMQVRSGFDIIFVL
jgi:hypothetical protein